MPLDSTFSYSNAPQAIIPKKKKYRSDEDGAFTLMSDPRVVRGSVVKSKGGGMPGTAGSKAGQTVPGKSRQATKEDESRREEESRSHQATYQYKVPVLVRPEIDLSQYLVEREPEHPAGGQKARPPKAAETQTDVFQERPDTPEYVPRKTGVDVETQVEDVSELFNYDKEVEPMLAVLCAKTIEQALFELSCEGELVNLQHEIEKFEESRVREQQWVTGKEQQTVADSCTKDLALKGLKREMAKQREVREKVAGVQAMQQMLPAMLEDVCAELYAGGEWRDPERQDIDEVFLPQVYTAARSQLNAFKEAQALVDELLLLAFEGKEAGCPCGVPHKASGSS